jgi:hypothetical protein
VRGRDDPNSLSLATAIRLEKSGLIAPEDIGRAGRIIFGMCWPEAYFEMNGEEFEG